MLCVCGDVTSLRCKRACWGAPSAPVGCSGLFLGWLGWDLRKKTRGKPPQSSKCVISGSLELGLVLSSVLIFCCLRQEGGRNFFNLSDVPLSCRYPVVPYSTQVQEVGVEQWRTRRRHYLGFQRAGPSSEFRSPSSGRKPPNSSGVSQHAATQYKTKRS